jgi:hypothetical protein
MNSLNYEYFPWSKIASKDVPIQEKNYRKNDVILYCRSGSVMAS